MKYILILLLFVVPQFVYGSVFDSVKFCDCPVCDCNPCHCVGGICNCHGCINAFSKVSFKQSWDEIYAQAIKDNQIIILEVGDVKHLKNTSWQVFQFESLYDEKPGYIVGVPTNGILLRYDFPPTTTREKIRQGIQPRAIINQRTTINQGY